MLFLPQSSDYFDKMTRLQYILELARPHRGRLTVVLIMTVGTTIVGLLPPLTWKFLIDNVIGPPDWKLLAAGAMLVAGIPLLSAVMAGFHRIMVASIGQKLVVDMRTSLYRHILSLSMRFHSEHGTGMLMNHLMTDVGIVQTMITGETLTILSSGVALIFNLAMVFIINPYLGAIVIVMLIIYILSYLRFSNQIRQANLELREIMDSVTGRLQERLAGVRLVKTYCRERDETNEFLASADRALEYGLRTQMLSVSLNAASRIIGGIGSTLVFSLSATFILLKSYSMRLLGHHTTYGDLVMVDNYLWMATWPAINLTTIAGQITQALVSLDRLIKLNIENLDVIDKPDAYDLPNVSGDIRISAIDFSYTGKEKLFDNLSMHIPAGKMTALVGHTGCGKTTITSLILRMWDIQDGSIEIDGHDIRNITLRSLRRHTGVVPQEPVVFEGTIFDNISYAVPDATLEMVIEAATAAQIHDYIITLPDGYYTILGKEGAKLSVGQKQRIASARAILCKPTILILDEATSALDTENERAVQEALEALMQDRTTLVIAHRISTIKRATRICVLNNGEIVESGRHDQLLALNGEYNRLYQLQFRN